MQSLFLPSTTSLFAVGILLLGGTSGCADDPAPGEMKLPDGFKHQRLQGIDSTVGKIWKEGGVSVQYDIGRLAGNYAKAQAKDKDQILWHKDTVIAGRPVQVTLSKDKTLYVSLAEETASFYGKVKSEEDVADVLLMVLTYKPAKNEKP